MENINYSKLPHHMQGAMRRYIEDGIMPGSFLTAVLENDLVGAFSRADEINKLFMEEYVRFIYNEAPLLCWGSPENVRYWSEKRQNEWRERDLNE